MDVYRERLCKTKEDGDIFFMETKHHEHHHLFSDASDVQMSEAFVNSAFLALSGGFQDAYTYNVRDEVFSNAQTGNVVLLALRYLLPVLSFALGVFIAEKIQGKFKNARRLHWRQGILAAEIVILFLVGFVPSTMNMLATTLVSFACAMQVQTFRKIHGYSYASTMCIGNLRSGTAALSAYWRRKDPKKLEQAGYYFGIIFLFALGAGVGGNLSIAYGNKMIWVCSSLLLVSFLLMFIERFKASND